MKEEVHEINGRLEDLIVELRTANRLKAIELRMKMCENCQVEVEKMGDVCIDCIGGNPIGIDKDYLSAVSEIRQGDVKEIVLQYKSHY